MKHYSSSITGVIVAVFLVAVVFNGNAKPLTDFISKQGGFIRWGIALLIIRYVAEESDNDIVVGFIYVALIAMLIVVSGNGSLKVAADEFNKTLFAAPAKQ